ncbi:hypothetical protein CesoFtcFv8_011559 [Champsocephalus esox]|uniref:Uncharacterized protein n=1 Tax=Champsocephalus esox TaxID=159716 RepID=A0AAN8BZV1_9TELE|nr:hypothetical protein CesoFtcFv8_011559 [Champsocephalus esox]
MAEPGLLDWDPGSRARLGSVLLTTARHTLGLSILYAGQWDCVIETACAHGLTHIHSPLSLPVTNTRQRESGVCDVTRSVQEAGGWWGGVAADGGGRVEGGLSLSQEAKGAVC